MKATTNGKTYDTKDATRICNDPSPDGDDELYQTAEGDFFLEIGSTYLDGRKLSPWEHYRDFAPELDGKPGDREKAAAERHRRLRSEKRLVPLTHREALIWCIKTQLPECFCGYVLESI